MKHLCATFLFLPFLVFQLVWLALTILPCAFYGVVGEEPEVMLLCLRPLDIWVKEVWA